MSYQVLARKYRPSNFQSLVGQDHVSRALHNALEQQRLHHAYLFTGTRGVGKTTIARILARCLNCETGITATPCGECGSCVEIAEGRSVDLIEVDAASRTRVEDTRELLEAVQYMPARSPFKVYLIDEVHMLSNHSFNALLKTLEEPPEHVKFLMATTDPKKLPITVLSRCLQFNLKNIAPETIVNHLSDVLGQESPPIPFDERALWQIGRAAAGSMRDALSLTDQAISYCDGTVTDEGVKGMLGTIDQMDIFKIIDALISQDAPMAMAHIRNMASFAPDYAGVLSDLLSVLHRIAVAQLVPDSLDNSQGDETLVRAAAEGLHPDDVQLFYQIGLTGSRDLPLSPDPREGFEMILLRMLAFREADDPPPDGATKTGDTGHADSHQTGGGTAGGGTHGGVSGRLSSTALKNELRSFAKRDVASLLAPIPEPKSEPEPKVVSLKPLSKTGKEPEKEPEKETAKVTPIKEPAIETPASGASMGSATDDGVTEVSESLPPSPPVLSMEALQTGGAEAVARTDDAHARVPEASSDVDWVGLFKQLSISGVTRTVASHCMVRSVDENHWLLNIEQRFASLLNRTHEKRISDALSEHLERRVSVAVEIVEVTVETPAQAHAREYEERKLLARDSIMKDDNIRQLIQTFGAELDQDSIEPKQCLGD